MVGGITEFESPICRKYKENFGPEKWWLRSVCTNTHDSVVGQNVRKYVEVRLWFVLQVVQRRLLIDDSGYVHFTSLPGVPPYCSNRKREPHELFVKNDVCCVMQLPILRLRLVFFTESTTIVGSIFALPHPIRWITRIIIIIIHPLH